MTYEIAAGWTAPVDIELLTHGAVPSGTMSGMSVAITMRERLTGTAVVNPGTIAVQDSANWVVQFTPAAGMVSGDYYGRVKVTDVLGGIAYFPSDEPDLWMVRA